MITRLIVGMSALMAIALGLLYMDHLIGKNAELGATVERLQFDIQRQSDLIEDARKQEQKRSLAIRQVQIENAQLKSLLEKANKDEMQNDPCLSAPVPDAVIELLREQYQANAGELPAATSERE